MQDKQLSPLKAIRAKCLECSGGKPSVVRNCDSVSCPLHSFRFAKNPARTGIGVGIRGQNGRFQKKVTGLGEVLKRPGEQKRILRALAVLRMLVKKSDLDKLT